MAHSEVQREGEDAVTLESGHLLYFQEGDSLSHSSEVLNEEIDTALHENLRAHFHVVMGDFNAKVGVRTNT